MDKNEEVSTVLIAEKVPLLSASARFRSKIEPRAQSVTVTKKKGKKIKVAVEKRIKKYEYKCVQCGNTWRDTILHALWMSQQINFYKYATMYINA